MKEAVKEELSWAACQLSLRTPAASGCLGDGPLWRTASAVALHCELWRQSVTVMGGYTMWTEKVPLEVNSTWSEGAGLQWRIREGPCINTWWEYVLWCAEHGGCAVLNIMSTPKARLPLLWPSGPRSIRHSSICPKDENIILTSFSPYFFETMPTKSFLSSTAAGRRK